MILERIYEEKLAHASYIVGCGASGEALVIDPNRNIDQYMKVAEAKGLRIVAIAETHIHADYVSGSLELARKTGATLYLSDEGGPDWKYDFPNAPFVQPVRDLDHFMVGNLKLEVMATPGHTPEHISFVLTDLPATSAPYGVFTGDFIFVGDVGRPDLLERAAGFEGTMERGAADLYQSIQNFLTRFPDDILLWPAHGAGSACGKGLGGVPVSSLGYEKRTNPGLKQHTLADFKEYVLQGQPEPPAYFKHMKRINRIGPVAMAELDAPVQLQLPAMAAMSVLGTLVDTREATTAKNGFLTGSLLIPESTSFTTWAGSLVRFDEPIYLISGSPQEAAEATLDLRMIGLDRVAGWVLSTELDSGACSSIQDVSAEHVLNRPDWQILDVRGQSEHDREHVPGAKHIPLGELASRLGELSTDEPIAVFCAAGTRSPMAASILVQNGFKQVYDLAGGFAEIATLPIAC
ncbi:MAG: MBL fold metallo-hydrolase [Fimbriimonadaceae bacterium]